MQNSNHSDLKMGCLFMKAEKFKLFSQGKIFMKTILTLLATLIVTFSGNVTADSSMGKFTGGTIYTLPDWFKSSFLDFGEDVENAREQGKHIMVFLHLDECPYCDRLIKENFISGRNRETLEEKFDSIAINILGDLDVIWIDGKSYTEQELTRRLNVVATPTMVFLDLSGKKVLQLNGYRDPESIRHALDYVDGKHYQQQSFSDYQTNLERPEIYSFRSHPKLEVTTYLKDYNGPLLVLFEDQYCIECGRFHEKTLNHSDVLEAMTPFLFIRLDSEATHPLVTPDGNVTTPKQWAQDLGLTYRPAVVMFNKKKERVRADGILYHLHFSEALLYTARKYTEYDSIRDFKDAYRAELMSSGKDVDFSE
jgi:thioredoxin-related protein